MSVPRRTMELTLTEARARLAASAQAIVALAAGVDAAQARWKPAPERWSILEVVNHLADEEVEDFRARLDVALHRSGEPLPPIDPEGWVTSRDYASRDPSESLQRFLRERERSLDWLSTLAEPDWTRTAVHRHFGDLSAGSLLASWAAHDLLHIRQLAKLRYDHLAALAAPHGLAYAGDW